MCSNGRIDDGFNVQSLNEEQDPVKRFEQALDEHGVSGEFRELLIAHFQENWKRVFRRDPESKLEDALKRAKLCNTDGEKCIAFLSAIKDDQLIYELTVAKELHKNSVPFIQFPPIVRLAKDVAKKFFPESLYSFFGQCFSDKTNFVLFALGLYGKGFFLSKEFFCDSSLMSWNDEDRNQFYWECFQRLCDIEDVLPVNVAKKFGFSLELINSPLTDKTNNIMFFMKYLEVWVKYDVSFKEGRRDGSVGNDVNLSLTIEFIVRNLQSSLIQMKEDSLNRLEEYLWLVWCTNSDVGRYNNFFMSLWVIKAEFIYARFKFSENANLLRHYGVESSSKLDAEKKSEFEKSLNNFCNLFLSKFSHSQTEKWMEWSISNDINGLLGSDQVRFFKSDIWMEDHFFEQWNGKFFDVVNGLSVQEKLRVFSAPPPDRWGVRYEPSYRLWGEYVRKIGKSDEFFNDLFYEWVKLSSSYLGPEERCANIEKGIGICRGRLRQKKLSEGEVFEIMSQLHDYLVMNPNRPDEYKALRHRLLLMRASQVPFATEAMDPEILPKRNNDSSSPASMRFLWLSDQEAYFKELEEFLKKLAEFCLERLKLRKGERIDVEYSQYRNDQALEPSPIWRQGYLKALIELGFDLGGKVHKQVNFIKISDPDENVREIAKECYKSIRRKSNKEREDQDFRRALLAAEWWLLLCQRQELGLDVNHEAALRTRRRKLRSR